MWQQKMLVVLVENNFWFRFRSIIHSSLNDKAEAEQKISLDKCHRLLSTLHYVILYDIIVYCVKVYYVIVYDVIVYCVKVYYVIVLRRGEAVVELVVAFSPLSSHDSVARAAAEEDLGEGSPEIPHGHRVDDRVHPGVQIPEPRKDRKQDFRSVNALHVANPVQNVSHEERDPAQAEDAHYDP